MPYLRYLCGVQHILCCVFVLFAFVLCLVCPLLPVSLDCPLLISPSVFSGDYFLTFPRKEKMLIDQYLDYIRTTVNLRQAQETLANFGGDHVLVFLFPKTVKFFDFPIF